MAMTGIAEEHDDAHVRHAFVADLVEDRIELHAVLDQQMVRLPAEREQALTGRSTDGVRTRRDS
jgi:hypothetical protein